MGREDEAERERERNVEDASRYLPPQIPEADIQLVFLAGLFLVGAAVLWKERKKTQVRGGE